MKDSIRNCGVTRWITHACSGPSFACSKFVYTGTGRSAIGLDAIGKRRNLTLRRSLRRKSSTRRVIAEATFDTLSIHSSHRAHRDVWDPSLGSTEGTQTRVRSSESPEFEELSFNVARASLRLDLPAKMPSTNKPGAQPLPPAPNTSLQGTTRGRRFRLARHLSQQNAGLCSTSIWRIRDPRTSCWGFTPACAGRVLGFALLYSPSDRGREALTAEILRCGDDHGLLAGLAHLYVYGLIRVCVLSVVACIFSC